MTRLRSTRRRLRVAVALCLAVGATGCESALAAPASVTVRYQERAPLTRDRLVVTVDDLRSSWYFEGVDFEPADDGWLVSRSLRFSASTGVLLTVAIRADPGSAVDAVATGEIMLPAMTNEQWRVDIFASELPPEVACGGCAGLARFAIAESSRPAARDWLYVRWTGTDANPTGPR